MPVDSGWANRNARSGVISSKIVQVAALKSIIDRNNYLQQKTNIMLNCITHYRPSGEASISLETSFFFS
jgi:hypothetical protein